MKKIFSITIVLLLLQGCNDHRKMFALSIKHYAGGPGISIFYFLNEEGISINTNCDLEDCEEKNVYNRKFTKEQSDSLSSLLKRLRLDTLKPKYITRGILDGLETELTFTIGNFTRSTILSNYKTPATILYSDISIG